MFRLDGKACNLYTHGQFGSYGPRGGTESLSGASPDPIGAIKAVSYRGGRVCRLDLPSELLASYDAFIRSHRTAVARLQRRHGLVSRARRIREMRVILQPFLAARHLTLQALRSRIREALRSRLGEACPPVGYVAARQKRLTLADVSSPVMVRILPREYDEFRVDIIFTARQPATSSSWYEDYLTNPPGCPSSAQGGEIWFGNIRAGKMIHDLRLIGNCEGTYHGLIGYMQDSGPIDQNNAGGGIPGRDGSIVVARFTFTVR